jgi:hypothetical protein
VSHFSLSMRKDKGLIRSEKIIERVSICWFEWQTPEPSS